VGTPEFVDVGEVIVKFGQFFLLEQFTGRTESEVYRDSLEQIQVADELGYHTAWLAEHRFSPYGIMPDTLLFGAAVAATTTRIRIGTAVVVLPFHHPILIAEQTAMLDVLSNGRFDFGVGRGYQAQEFRSFNIDMDESRERFEETLNIIQGLWATDNFSYQ
jgi:alkanesulfonate monooxygenase SsuD/methylene tetrahydromethanopterin reductase-like flavin-dependent oxidoreductase (luciferase family)